MKDVNAVALGKKGGSARTEAKKAAVTENLKRAREKRWDRAAIEQTFFDSHNPVVHAALKPSVGIKPNYYVPAKYRKAK